MLDVDTMVVARRIEEFRKSLLDTSMRNRLINFRVRTKAGKSLEKVVEVSGANPADVLQRLVVDGKTMSFIGRPDPKQSELNENMLGTLSETIPLFESNADSADILPNSADEGKQLAEVNDAKLMTREFASVLNRKLTKISRDANLSLEEQGVNVLYLALGMLEWYEDGNSNESRHAPLIMVPVTLERTAHGALRLRWDGGEIGENLSIAAKLRGSEFGLKMPPLSETVEPDSYFQAVSAMIQHKPNWRVNTQAIALAFFSYAKFLMYKDLDPEEWPNGSKPGEHATVGALLDSGFEEHEDGIAEEAFLDPLRVPGDTCEIYDADSSQTLAILEANTGRSMLIEGPPGTGKSQTIANIIAEAVGSGRKVLFIAEKAAALDVVFRRLREAGLGDACLELHSNKTNKRSFYAELKRTVQVSAPKAAKAANELRQLTEARAALNSYCEAINEPLLGRDISPRFAIGSLMRLHADIEEIGRQPFEPMQDWTQADFQFRWDHVRRLQEHLQRMGIPTSHPFWGSQLDMLLPDDKEDIRHALIIAEAAVETFAAAATLLSATLKVEGPVRPADLDRLEELANYVAHAPHLAGISVSENDWPEARGGLDENIANARWLKMLLTTLRDRLANDALEQDPGDIASALRLDTLTPLLIDWSAGRLGPVLDALEAAQIASESLETTAYELAQLLCVMVPHDLGEMESLASLAKKVAGAPDLNGMAVADDGWKEASEDLKTALENVTRIQTAQKKFGTVLTEQAWKVIPELMITVLEKYGNSFWGRLFNRSFKSAYREAGTLFINAPQEYGERVNGLRAIAEVSAANEQLADLRGTCSAYFNERWNETASDVMALRAAISWIVALHESIRCGKVPLGVLNYFARGTDARLASLADELRTKLADTRHTIGVLRQALRKVGGIDLDHSGSGHNDQEQKLYRWHLDSLRPRLANIGNFLLTTEGYANTLERLDRIAAARTLITKLANERELLEARFSLHWRAEESAFDYLTATVDWLADFHQRIRSGDLPGGLIAFFAENDQSSKLQEVVQIAQAARQKSQIAVRKVMSLAKQTGDPTVFTEAPMAEQRQRLAEWLARLDDLQSLIVYNSLAAEAHRYGLHETIRLAESWLGAQSHLAEAFVRAWYTGVLREAMRERPVLARFERTAHEQLAAEFRHLDRLLLEINRRKVQVAHWRSVPRHNATGALGWLQAQMELGNRHKPVRVAMSQAHEAIQAIKPVYLMSPLSIAMYLPANGPRFDVVLFDEASQVKPEDAFGGILRAQQCVVVGDSKQMPPTSFFDKLTGDDGTEDDEEIDEVGKIAKDLESVLALMSSKVPPRSPRRRDLCWHYRSRHDSLITTSNRLFYDNRLVVFPSPQRHGAGAGLILRHDPTTIYGRGAKRTNPKEAKQIAEAALHHVREHPELTFGIAAFSKAQREQILDEIDLLRRDHDEFTAFDSRHPFEPLFVKNLENVQGDERDVILISVGYGRDEAGYVSMSFGPLNRDGGERRLNVLITRARIRCEVFTNLRGADIRVGENPGRGIVALKHFLTFAETGSLDIIEVTGREPISPFEEEVLDRLRALGYDVEPQIGSAGFFIDMAVRHPEDARCFVLGIECDGAMYYRARAARDRDKLRQDVLESRGWRLHRIWSIDWFQNPERELKRVVCAIQLAIAAANPDKQETIEYSNVVMPEIELLDMSEEIAPLPEAIDYVFSKVKSPARNVELHELTPRDMATWIGAIVKDESPVHTEEVLRRIREAMGVGRAGTRIRTGFDLGLAMAKDRKLCVVREEFLYHPDQTQYVVRSRSQFSGSSKTLARVANEEIDAAIEAQIRRSFRLPRADAPVAVSRMLGFERVTEEMAERISDRIDDMLANNILSNDEGGLRISPY